jgi:flagellar hook-associated protein 1 FlgK
MGVLANNVANANNPSYSRQRVEFAAMSPDRTGSVETGRGITLASVTQVVNDAVELRLNDSIQDLSKNETTAGYLQNIENIMNEVQENDGLSKSLADFFNSFSALAAEPESTTARRNVLNSAESVIDMFQSYGDQLAKMRSSVDTEIRGLLPEINAKLQEIGDINVKIRDSSVDPLTYLDTRREMLNDLSEMIDVNVIDNGDDMQIYTKSGLPLVSGLSVASFDVDIDVTNDNLYSIQYTMGGSTTDVTDRIQSGQLKGLLDARDTYFKDYQDKLDDLAYTFATDLNAVHATGYDLNGATGNNFFQDLGGVVDDAARNLSLDAAVDNDPKGIAISANINEIPGGNDIANDIADLYESTTVAFQDGSQNSFAGFFGDLLSTIGNDSKIAQNGATFYENTKTQVTLERSQESGVNIDEEQVEMIKLQAAYQAAGQMMKVADTILQSLFEALNF